MLSIKIEDKKTTVEVNGTVGELIDEALNIVGHLYKTLERTEPKASHMFLLGIPMIIKDYADHAEEYEKGTIDHATEKEETSREDNAI